MSLSRPALGRDAGHAGIPAAMEAFSNLAEDWGLNTDEQITLLGSPGRSTFFKWKKEGGNLFVVATPRDEMALDDFNRMNWKLRKVAKEREQLAAKEKELFEMASASHCVSRWKSG